MVPVTITSGDKVTPDGSGYRVPKRDLIVGLQVALQKRWLRIAKSAAQVEEFRKELLHMRLYASPVTGYERYEAPGHDDMVMAAALAWVAGEAALRVGAGLVTVAGAAENLLAVTATRPELIYLPESELEQALRGAGVIAIGPGLGRTPWARELWRNVLDLRDTPVVVDADALNLLAESPGKLPANWILTPHPGEAGRLLGSDARAVQADRLGAARELHSRYGAVVVLKGAGTLVASGEGETRLAICERGNPGMATAGMGDVLTGVIAGLRSQIGDSASAARVGVLVHALAGDSAAQRGQRGLIASDVCAELRGWVNP
jgi:NAD(P)H-hydrate epimerase